MMVACSNEELVPNEVANTPQEAAKGIVFEVAPANLTKGVMDETYHFKWFAESDRVNIYATNVQAYEDNAKQLGVAGNANFKKKWDDVNENWIDGIPTPAVYKATQSASTGVFTAINDENWIQFIDGDHAVAVIATYPQSTTVIDVEANTGRDNRWSPWRTTEIKNVKISTGVRATQKIKFNEVIAPMLSYQVNHKQGAYYESVGERLPLSFTRPFPVVKFSGASNNDSFNADLGKLQQVSLTTKGGQYDNNHLLAPTKIAGDATYESKENKTDLTDGTTTNSVKVVLGETWNSSDNIYMAILPVKRIAVKSDGTDPKQPVVESMEVEYRYENVTLRRYPQSSSHWTEPNSIVPMETLDIENMYNYIVTKNTNNRKLIVNKGSLRDAFANDDYVVWDDENTSTVTINNVSRRAFRREEITAVEVRSGANPLTADDYKLINSMTNLKSLVVRNNTTTITRNALSNLSKLETLQMDHVNNIEYIRDNDDWKKPVNSANLKYVYMPEYDFSTNRTLTATILNASTLTELNMRGVASMKEVYPKEGMSLKNYTKLEKVFVQDGVILGPEAFYNCSLLNTVDGYVTLGGYGAFQRCAKLPKVRIDETTKIYDYTFDGATSLQHVYDRNWNSIAPAEIGIAAFRNTKTNIDLTQSVTIKSSAFEGNSSICGVWDNGKGINALTVNASTIGSNAFKGCTALQYICFNNLTTVNAGLLEGAGEVNHGLYELKFAKKVTFGSNVQNTVFGTTANTKLFVNPSQSYTGNRLNITTTTGGTSTTFSVSFSTIIEE